MVLYTSLAGAALDARNKIEAALLQKATKELNLSRAELTVRELRPEDLGLSTPEWTHTGTAATWSSIVNAHTMADNRFVGIYGVRYAQTGTQSFSQLEITRAGNTVRYYHIQGTAYLEDQTQYFDDPVTIEQNTTVTIKAYPVTTVTAEKMVLLGLVVEKKGLLVSD